MKAENFAAAPQRAMAGAVSRLKATRCLNTGPLRLSREQVIAANLAIAAAADQPTGRRAAPVAGHRQNRRGQERETFFHLGRS